MINNSLKEYYIKLTNLYNNATSMLEAMNQCLTSSSSEINVSVITENNEEVTLRIPSVLYIESKLEQLENNMNNLFNMPNNGEAWFTNNGDMYKLEMIKSTASPATPEVNVVDTLKASSTDNNALKDLVTPKTYIKLSIDNLPENIEDIYMKKIVFHSQTIFNNIKSLNLNSYSEYKSALYNYRQGVDYDEYESTLRLPIKKDTYESNFEIVNVVDSYTDSVTNKINYTLNLSSLQYHDQEDLSIEYTLKKGDKISLDNQLAIYTVKEVDVTQMLVKIEETIGHINLQTFEENSQMVLKYYNPNYSQFHYVDIPLEEDQYICIFIGTIYNNIRSLLSKPYLIDLSTIYMYDKYGNPITDSYGNQMNYIEYYNKYCLNIGDLILGITQSAYPQLSNLTTDTIATLQESNEIKKYVSESFSQEGILEVVPINKHLIDDVTTEDLINLHSQKSEINSQLLSVQDNINTVYSKLVNTDFNQEVNITQESLKSQLDGYYGERTTLQKQLNAIVDNINTIALDVTLARQDTKYRIRGITVTDTL